MVKIQCQRNFLIRRRDTVILGNGGGRQEGGRKWASSGGFGFFRQGGEALFASEGGRVL